MAIPTLEYLDRPFIDGMMDYDYDEQMYIPLVKGILEYAYVNLIVDWKTEENAQAYLQLVARVVYETILSLKDPKYRIQMLYYMSHSKKARVEMFKLFSDTAWYNRRDGGFMMAYNTGANLNQGKLIEFGVDKALSPIAKQLVLNTYLGTKYLPYDINTTTTFDDLPALVVYLVDNTYITAEQALLVEYIDDLML